MPTGSKEWQELAPKLRNSSNGAFRSVERSKQHSLSRMAAHGSSCSTCHFWFERRTLFKLYQKLVEAGKSIWWEFHGVLVWVQLSPGASAEVCIRAVPLPWPEQDNNTCLLVNSC